MSRLQIFTDGLAYPDESQIKGEPVDKITLNLTRELEHQNEYTVLILSGDQSYRRRIEGAMEVLTYLGHAATLSKESYDSQITKQGFNIQFAEMFRALAYFTGYLQNSTSWHDQELHDFDVHELHNRLDKIKRLLNCTVK